MKKKNQSKKEKEQFTPTPNFLAADKLYRELREQGVLCALDINEGKLRFLNKGEITKEQEKRLNKTNAAIMLAVMIKYADDNGKMLLITTSFLREFFASFVKDFLSPCFPSTEDRSVQDIV